MEMYKGETVSGGLSRTLVDVAQEDYFGTQKLIRQIFMPKFDPQEYDFEIREIREWVARGHGVATKLEVPEIPETVKKNRFTLGLFMELSNDILVPNPIFKELVAFELGSEGLEDDLLAIKRSGFKADEIHIIKNPDLLSFVVFHKYWQVLNSRAKLLQK